MGRKTITVSKDVYDLVDDAKRDGESFSDTLRRLVEAEGQAEVLTVDHIPDIANSASSQTVRELEDSLTRGR